jgi:ketosteroid isomerase-like protein
MSAADVEVVTEMLDRFNRQEYEGATELLDDRIEMYQAAEIPGAEHYVGKDDFLRGMAHWLSGFERGFQYLPQETVDCGDRVFVRVLMRGTGRGSGAELEQEVFQICRVEDGRIVRVDVFWRESDAREAAGLTPG